MINFALSIYLTFGTTPYLPDSRGVLRRCADANIELLGRDPCAGSGFCCALLPVHSPQDVYYVHFSRLNFGLDHLLLLRHFPNVTQVRCCRAMTEIEHELVMSYVPLGTWLLYGVERADGTILSPRPGRSGYRLPVEDTNGDGVIDEDDEIIPDAKTGE